MSEIAYRDLEFFASDVSRIRRSDGSYVLASVDPLGPYDRSVGEWLERWSARAPERKFIVEQREAGEVAIDYREMQRRVLLLSEGLLELDLGEHRPIVVLASNCIDHAVLMLAALHAGIAIAPLAPAYALQTTDHSKLIRSLELLTPGLIVVEDGVQYSAAAASMSGIDVSIVALRNAGFGMRSLQDLYGDGSRQNDVTRASRAVRASTIAKFLFTSGSSGVPKAVVNTHGMLCAAARMQQQIAPFLLHEPPTMVDWLPWNHTAGGNSNFNIILANGGTLYIDPGKPTVDLIGKSIELLKRVSPTLYFNVPMGFDALLPHLEADVQLNATFFREMKYLWYAAAAMQPSTWAALERLAIAAVGKRVLIVTGLGMTETSPLALFGNKAANGPGVVGIPAPGLELKLIPHGDLFETRYRGPNVTPGYWRDASATAAAFDEEGFFRSGDLVAFVDESRPELGVTFEGRLSEDFKISSGTKVAAGALRLMALFVLGPLVKDVVITGEGRNDVRILIFADWRECARQSGLDSSLSQAQLVSEPSVRSLFQDRVSRITAQGTGSSNRIVAAMLVDDFPTAEAGELTEKGTINAGRLLKNRPWLLDVLYGEADARVLFG